MLNKISRNYLVGTIDTFLIRREKEIIIVFALMAGLIQILPFLLFGKDSTINIRDNLDQMLPYFKMFHDNNLFLNFDAPTRGFSEMSTLYFTFINYSFQSLLFSIFSDFSAYCINIYFATIFGLLSMYLLLKKVINIPILIVIISLLYSILPGMPVILIGINTLPLVIFCFISFFKKSSFSRKSLLLLLYPIFSTFTYVGIFILGFWFIATIILAIKDKRINPNLLTGFLALCIGYILVDLRLFYVMFVVKEPLNRSIFDFKPHTVIQQLRLFWGSFKGYAGWGYYHATSMQRYVILPTAGIISIFSFLKMFLLMREATGSMFDRGKKVLVQTENKIKLLFILEFLVVIFSGIAALCDSGLIDGFIRKYIPLLTGFDWGRVCIFNRSLWYIIFALCIYCILQIDTITFAFHDKSEKFVFPPLLPKIVTIMLIGLQFLYILSYRGYYNDQTKTWFNEIFIKKGIAKKIFPQREFNGFISYREFFAEDLFAEIKKDIVYSDEKVVAFGYHPSVLMYNGFNCIDGYNNAYPLSYMKKFRTLIAPELEVNKEMRDYYDSWGGRMYLYNSELSFEPTRNKNTSPVKLNIDIEVFRNDFNGKYILSRAEISNSEALGLDFVKRYYDEGSIYTIFLYQCN